MPGATPPLFQNAQTDTPGRALTTNINGTNRNSNVTRIDGAASINVWLPHHAGYIAPAETIENVNISTNSFDAAQGHDRRRGDGGADEVGHEHLQGIVVLLPPAGRAQRAARLLRSGQGRREHVDLWRHGRRSDPAQQAVLLRIVGAQRRAAGHLRQLHRADREDAQRRLQRSAGAEPELPHLRSGDRHLRRRGPHVLRERDHSRQSHQRDLEGTSRRSTRRRTIPARTTACRTTLPSAHPEGRPRQLRRQGQLEPHDLRIRSGASSR